MNIIEIRKLISESNIPVTHIAREAKINLGYMYGIANGQRNNPTLEMCEKIVAAIEKIKEE